MLTDPENGVLNPLGLNAIRTFPAFGPVAWGARTLVGSDALASEWKYIPVRRLGALPRGEPLPRHPVGGVRAERRAALGADPPERRRLHAQPVPAGRLPGETPREAYLVQCDSTTTTQDDINLGIVNIIVGFAPLKPAEFVIIKLQQLAGQAGAGA